MKNLTALQFAELARDVTQAARSCGLQQPSFRTPPRTPGQHRSIKRYGDGSAIVSVAIKERASNEVLNDMIEGVIVVNRLPPKIAIAARRTIYRLSSHHSSEAA